MKNFKRRLLNVINIVLILFAALIMHELMYAIAKYLIPYPVALGMIGGFTLGFLYHKKP